jgi:Ceramidase
MLSWSTAVRDYCERTGPGFWAEPANELSSLAFLLAALIAFRRWRHAGGNDIASLGLIVVVAAVGLGSFAFHALATLGAAVLDVGPIAVFICSYLFLALHRFLRSPALIAVSLVLAFVVLSALAQRLVPTGILNGSIGYVPALGVMCLVALLALLRARTERARDVPAPAPAGIGPAGEPERARKIGWLLLATSGVFATSLVLRSIDFAACRTIPIGTHFLWHLLNAWVLYRLICGTIDWRCNEQSLRHSARSDPGGLTVGGRN